MASEPEFIPLVRPSLGEAEAEATRRVILSGWVTQGPEVAALEKDFAEQVGAAHACAVSNCTSALHLALLALGVGPGDEVITVSHSFIATANSIRYCGAVPVFVDIESAMFNMDPGQIKAAITPRTRAILCVHQMGMPCDMEKILAVAGAHSLPVIEDAACAIGSEILWKGRWERIGRPNGAIACFSFHPRKVITAGEGGILTTSNPELDQRFRALRQHAMTVSDVSRHQTRSVTFESYPEIGYNYRMTDIQAAVAREQLKRLADIVAERRRLADRYKCLLSDVKGVEAPGEPAFARTNWQSYCVRLPDGADQQRVMQKMLDRGVATRRGIMCSHREGAHKSPDSRTRHPLLESEKAQEQSILLPLFPGLSETQQKRVAEALQQSLE